MKEIKFSDLENIRSFRACYGSYSYGNYKCFTDWMNFFETELITTAISNIPGTAGAVKKDFNLKLKRMQKEYSTLKAGLTNLSERAPNAYKELARTYDLEDFFLEKQNQIENFMNNSITSGRRPQRVTWPRN